MELNQNIKAYELLKSNPEWVNQFKGKYVGFLNGEHIITKDTEKELVMEVSDNFPDSAIFFAFVTNDDVQGFDAPSPLFVEDVD